LTISGEAQVIFAPGTTIGSRYRLKGELAKGGMGSVWVAKHLQLEVDVAIKFMAPAAVSSAVARARFEREAKAAAQLHHPNIVHVHDFGIEGDTPYLVMELLRGESLDERLKRERSLSLQATAALLIPIGRGLKRAHEAGFVHRDLKPGNIFISGSEDEEIVKILDFGIAKQTGAAADNNTKTGEFIGSPHYMSPEQITDAKDIDARSDLWSLGVILYRAITGEVPFPGDTIGAVMGSVLTGTAPRPSHRLRALPEALDHFFERAFARDRAQRFGTAKEMVNAFVQISAAGAQSVPARSRDSGGAWQAPRPPLVNDADEDPDAQTRLLASHFAGDARGSGSTERISEPAQRQRTSTVGGASLPAVGPHLRGGRTVKLPLPAGGPPPQEDARAPGASPGQPHGRDLSMMAAGTLTASPTAVRNLHAEGSGGREAGPPPEQRSRRAVMFIGAAAVGLALAIGALFLVFQREEQPRASSPEVALGTPSSERESAVPSPSPPAPTALLADPGQTDAAPSESATAEPLAVVLAESDGVDSGAPAPPQSDGGAPPPKPSASAPAVKGFVKLKITAKGAGCKVTVNGRPYGDTPVGALVQPGPVKVYCRKPNGEMRQTEIKVVEGRINYVEFR
jgi:serine/threonine-protein kinase